MIRTFDYLEELNFLRKDVLAAITRVLDSGRLILGPEVERFEQGFGAWLGGTNVVGVGNGTDAITITLRGLGIGPGDEVITVANTAVPTVSAIREVGAMPVFCDVDEDTALLDVSVVDRCITERTRAILAVHLFGNVVDIAELRARVGRRDIAIIEDCAQAHGASFGGALVGTLGDAATFSFYPTKNLGAYGDGGACVTRDDDLAARMRSIRMYGFEDRYYSVREGVNSRLDELQAAILSVKLPHLGPHVARRREIAARYNEGLVPLVKRIGTTPGSEAAFHLYVIRVPDRDRVKTELAEREIATGIHYPFPIHRMTAYESLGYAAGSLPVTERLAGEILSLPMYPELPNADVDRVVAGVNAAVS